MPQRYADRSQAGIALGEKISDLGVLSDALVIALPRGGVPIGLEVARRLAAPLDIVTVKKVGAPTQPELACGAVTSDGSIVWNDALLGSLGLTQAELKRSKERAVQEAHNLERALRSSLVPALSVFGKTVIVVDDGLATGATMKAAIKALLIQKPHRIIVAVPVGPDDTCREIEAMGYEMVCPLRLPPGKLMSVGEWYNDFSQVGSTECRGMLEQSRATYMQAGSDERRAVH